MVRTVFFLCFVLNEWIHLLWVSPTTLIIFTVRPHRWPKTSSRSLPLTEWNIWSWGALHGRRRTQGWQRDVMSKLSWTPYNSVETRTWTSMSGWHKMKIQWKMMLGSFTVSVGFSPCKVPAGYWPEEWSAGCHGNGEAGWGVDAVVRRPGHRDRPQRRSNGQSHKSYTFFPLNKSEYLVISANHKCDVQVFLFTSLNAGEISSREIYENYVCLSLYTFVCCQEWLFYLLYLYNLHLKWTDHMTPYVTIAET